MANWNFNPQHYSKQEYSIIPEGNHRVRIADVEEKTFNSGNHGFEIALTVNGYNSKLWFYLVLDHSNPERTNQRLGEFFDSFGIQNTILGNGRQWIGATGAVRVRHEEFNGKQQAKVAFCISRDRQDKLEPWKATNNAAPAQTQVTMPFGSSRSDLPFEM